MLDKSLLILICSTFQAGKMYMKNQMVHPDKRKGQLYLYQADDSLMHFCWKDRTTGTVEEVCLCGCSLVFTCLSLSLIMSIWLSGLYWPFSTRIYVPKFQLFVHCFKMTIWLQDLIVFPEDCEYKRVSQCTTGRVYVLIFKLSSRRLFFWMQVSNTGNALYIPSVYYETLCLNPVFILYFHMYHLLAITETLTLMIPLECG